MADTNSAATAANAAGTAATLLGSPVLGSIVSGIGSFLGGSSSNSANRKLQQQLLDWQAQMAATAHQRQVADMRKAGLNPRLSAMGGSGAATPAGTPGHAQQDVITPALNSANAALRLKYEVKNMEEQNKNLQETTKNIAANTTLQNAQAGKAAVETANSATSLPYNRLKERVFNQVTNTMSSAAQTYRANGSFMDNVMKAPRGNQLKTLKGWAANRLGF